MKPTDPLAAIALFAIVTLEFGGWSLLGFLTSEDRISPFEEQFFRAGHGHAGVPLILALVFSMLMERTAHTRKAQPWWSRTLLVAILLQSGGLFVHMLAGEEGSSSAGTWITRSGRAPRGCPIGLGVGLLRSNRTRTA